LLTCCISLDSFARLNLNYVVIFLSFFSFDLEKQKIQISRRRLDFGDVKERSGEVNLRKHVVPVYEIK
jgi:hypothetical protein